MMTRTHPRRFNVLSRPAAALVAAAGLALVSAPALALAQGSSSTPKQDNSADKMNLSDDRIRTAVEREINAAKHVPLNPINISVNNGIVTLDGSVPHILARQRATRIASMVKGVRSVVNQLQVKDSGRSDNEIRSDVIAALAGDPATDSWEIGVGVTGGTATLTGAVDSYAERTLASDVARAVKGVRAIDNQITVVYATDRPDSEIKQDVVQRLNWDARIDDGLILVNVDRGKVSLAGSVGSDWERRLAIAAGWVAGAKSVNADNLTVEWWARDNMKRLADQARITDSQIRQAVVDAMLYDPRVASFRPTVTVNNGVVTLTGTVQNLKAKRAAAQDADNTLGVRRVKNYLRVQPATGLADSAIETNVKDALTRDIIVSRDDITVDVWDGTAYLYGQVDSYYDRVHASDVAARAIGVTDVENHLTVGYDSLVYNYDYDWDPIASDFDNDYWTTTVLADDQIRDDIESELFWSPFVDSDDVTVTVVNGVATLTGTAEDWSEFDAATENALEGGAVRVVNKLAVGIE